MTCIFDNLKAHFRPCLLLSDTKQNKGSILKASVDYIIQVKNDVDEAKKVQEANKYLMSINKKLLSRIKVIFLSHGELLKSP